MINLLEQAFARVAPLSIPLVLHLLGETKEHLEQQIQQQDPRFLRRWISFEQQVWLARDQVFHLLSDFARSHPEHQTIRWFREQVIYLLRQRTSEETRTALSNVTIAEWKKNHLLRPPTKGLLEIDAVAAILIACLADPLARRQHFLPDHLAPDEPYWYCYARFSPSEPITVCPVPLPATLPPKTLLWTPWAGAGMEVGTVTGEAAPWLSFGSQGAARWAGGRCITGKPRWFLQVDDLRTWDPSLSEQDLRLLLHEGLREESLHTIAHLTLMRLAEQALASLRYDMVFPEERRYI
ncbi:MAG TPA: hypothetical protein VFV38_05035 [Ktedonobacteraceae bacterium]|nr:hypothetical protein [Ktedonobacteraceae bacterium]